MRFLLARVIAVSSLFLAGCSSDSVDASPSDASTGDSVADTTGGDSTPGTDAGDAGFDAHPAKGVFPNGFLWGGATAGYQVESTQPVESDWSVWETLGKVKNGDKAANGPDEWTHYDADLALAQSMGHNAFRLSIEWARIEPVQGTFDEDAIAHYTAVIASCKAHGLKPVVTLWHFSDPKWVLDPSGGPSLGGWAKQATADAFVSYVTRIVPRFADSVDLWITLNEPMIDVIQGYVFGSWPPGESYNDADAIAAHNALIDAHVRSYDAIHAIYAKKNAPVAVTIASHWIAFDPNTPGDADATKALERLVDYAFLDAIVKGDVDVGLDGKNVQHRADYANHLDVLGVNYYRHQLVTAAAVGIVPGVASEDPKSQYLSDLGWELYPAGMGRGLDALWARYSLPILITENGVADAKDVYRAWYLTEHVQQVQQAIQRGVDVRGYLHWSLIDNFEWAEGLAPRFGLVAIDYSTAARTRTARTSAGALTDIISANEVTTDVLAKWGVAPVVPDAGAPDGSVDAPAGDAADAGGD